MLIPQQMFLSFICEHKPTNLGVCYLYIIGGGDSSDHGLFGELHLTQPDEQGEHNNSTSCVHNIESFTITRCMWIGTIYKIMTQFIKVIVGITFIRKNTQELCNIITYFTLD